VIGLQSPLKLLCPSNADRFVRKYFFITLPECDRPLFNEIGRTMEIDEEFVDLTQDGMDCQKVAKRE
jgi:hypothetical protein